MSELIHHEEWHAGVHMKEEFYKFLQFLPGGFWLSASHKSTDSDFEGLVSSLDVATFCRTPKAVSSPFKRDGTRLFEFGTFQLDGNLLTLIYYFASAEMTFVHYLSIIDKGRELRDAKNNRFFFHSRADFIAQPTSLER